MSRRYRLKFDLYDTQGLGLRKGSIISDYRKHTILETFMSLGSEKISFFPIGYVENNPGLFEPVVEEGKEPEFAIKELSQSTRYTDAELPFTEEVEPSVLMEKINEIVRVVNRLNEQLIDKADYMKQVGEIVEDD